MLLSLLCDKTVDTLAWPATAVDVAARLGVVGRLEVAVRLGVVAIVGVFAKLGVGMSLGRVVRLGVVAATLDTLERLCVTQGCSGLVDHTLQD